MVRDVFFSLFIANGITGIRDAGGEVPVLLGWRKGVEEGKIVGPRMLVAGQFITTKDQYYGYGPDDLLPENADEASQAVKEVKNSGADYAKIMAFPSDEVFIAFAEEAKRQGIPFVGHVEGISVFTASKYGYGSIEHLGAILAECADPLSETPDYHDNKPFLDAYNEQKATMLFKHLAENNTRVCPTLILYYNRHNFEIIDTCDVRLKYMPSHYKTHVWFPFLRDRLDELTKEKIKDNKKDFQKYLDVILQMHRNGVKLLAGTDTASPFNIPGFSLHEEIILYAKAGLTPLEALKTATINPAEFLIMQDSLGSIEEGKLADLVLLDADPLEDIRNIDKINSVVLNGRFYTRIDLDKMLSDCEAIAGRK
jgi:imidazolonepropionase-like amidohydrolase